MTPLNLHSNPTYYYPVNSQKNPQTIYNSIIDHQNGEGKETLQLREYPDALTEAVSTRMA